MKAVKLNKNLMHVETELGIVNIRTGLRDRRGRRVESIQVLPSGDDPHKKVVRWGKHNTRLVELKTVKP